MLSTTTQWSERYRDKHNPCRITDFPHGIAAPKKVRIYLRSGHYLLQFWDPKYRKTLNERVTGDLLEAIVRAREIDQRLISFKQSGVVPVIEHGQLVSSYLKDLELRCEAGEIDSKTVDRYRTAVEIHYLEFCNLQSNCDFKHITGVDREFQLALATYLSRKLVSPNGHPSTRKKWMTAKGQSYVLDCVKAMYEWAADPQRGQLLPDGFKNPFLRRCRTTSKKVIEQITRPDVTIEMAVDLLNNCDLFQLQIFSNLILFGLRPSEISWLFRPDIEERWVAFCCREELDYFSKGRQNKRFPLLKPIANLFSLMNDQQRQGFVFLNRSALKNGRQQLPPDLPTLIRQHSDLREKMRSASRKEKGKVRDRMFRDHGQLSYDQIKREFDQLSVPLKWPKAATLKDLRHLFSTSLENAGVPLYFRKYLMGQSFGNSPIVAYTHVTEEKLEEHFRRAIEVEMSPIVTAIEHRTTELIHSADRQIGEALPGNF